MLEALKSGSSSHRGVDERNILGVHEVSTYDTGDAVLQLETALLLHGIRTNIESKDWNVHLQTSEFGCLRLLDREQMASPTNWIDGDVDLQLSESDSPFKGIVPTLAASM